MEGRGRFCYTKNNVNYALNSFFHWKHCCSWDEKIQRGYPGGGRWGCTPDFKGQISLEILFQRLLSIVYTTISFNLNSIIVILSG